MLPTAGPLPAGPGWAFEMKWDGIRIVTETHVGELRMVTRHGNDIAARFPELHQITDVGDVVLDGELVVFGHHVDTDFAAAVSRLRAKPSRVNELAKANPAHVVVFDLLRLDGSDLRSRSYTARRELLEGLALPAGWSVSPAYDDGPAALETSLRNGLEGVVAKRLSSRYESRRSRNWIKVKHASLLDVVVAGWVRRASGSLSLLLAEPVTGGLAYVGRCTAPRNLVDVLEPLAADSPAVAVPAQAGTVHWVRPELEVEVTAASRGPDGRLRQARFVRARLDQLG